MNYLLVSHDPYRKEKAIKELVSKFPPDIRQAITLNSFHADTDKIEDILLEAGTMPFGNGHRMVIVKNAEKFDEGQLKAMSTYLKKPLETTTLILEVETEPTRAKAWEEIKRSLKTVVLENLTGNAFDKWVSNEAKLLGKDIARDAVLLLRQLIGEGAGQTIKSELEKLVLYVADQPEITRRDVETMVGKTKDEDIFELTRMITNKDAKGAMRIVSALLAEKTRPHEILGLLAWQLRKYYLVNNSARVSKKEAQVKIELLLNTDLAIKRSSIDPMVALEVSILKLCAGF